MSVSYTSDDLASAKRAIAYLPRRTGVTFRGIPLKSFSKEELVMLLSWSFWRFDIPADARCDPPTPKGKPLNEV